MGAPVFVCNECPDGRYLRRWLKKRAKETNVVKSGCLDVCPKGKVSVSIGGEVLAVNARKKKKRKALLALLEPVGGS